MKHINWKQEVWFILVMALPIVYLIYIWHQLPVVVPTHFNAKGIANDWNKKSTLVIIILSIQVMSYVLFLLLPYFDPKRKIKQMGKTYVTIRLIISLFLSLVSFFIIHSAKMQHISDNWMVYFYVAIGLFFIFLGNYLPETKPNYFIGLRTPWTLNSDYDWKKSHHLAGKCMFIAGILLIFTALFIPANYSSKSDIQLWIIMSSVLIPAAYSYIVWRNEKKITKPE